MEALRAMAWSHEGRTWLRSGGLSRRAGILSGGACDIERAPKAWRWRGTLRQHEGRRAAAISERRRPDSSMTASSTTARKKSWAGFPAHDPVMQDLRCEGLTQRDRRPRRSNAVHDDLQRARARLARARNVEHGIGCAGCPNTHGREVVASPETDIAG